ncbi:MAG TPA: AMIN domain-containing protein, partial [Terriglobales bacterium]|nr:AMIN domain-containing protein [Terriglobales bacterium]
MRKQQLGVVLPLLIVFLVAAAAQTQNTGTVATTHAALQRLNVVRGDGAISVEFTARGPVTPKLSTLSSPARVVIDLPNTVALTDQHQIAVDSDGVKGVRVGMSGQTPPNTRVVVDLDQACKFELVPGDDNKFAVKLYPGVAMVKTAKPVVAKAAARKATTPKLLTVSAVTSSAPAAAPVVAEKKQVAAQAAATTPAAPAVTASASKTATDYVF